MDADGIHCYVFCVMFDRLDHLGTTGKQATGNRTGVGTIRVELDFYLLVKIAAALVLPLGLNHSD